MHPSERVKGIDIFVSAADAGSFTAAAERLSLTSSAVGKAIARLETRLGVRLFARTTRRLALTDAGAAFYRVCVKVLDELEEAEHVLRAEGQAPTGRLRLDLPVSFGRHKVLPVLLPFFQRYPGLQPVISFTDRFVDMAEEGIDIAVRIGGPDHWHSSLGHRYLGHEKRVFFAAPQYLAQRGTPDSIAALLAHDAVLYGKADGSSSPWLLRHGAGPVEQRAMDARVVFGNAEAQVDAVVAGLGIAQLPTWLIDQHLQRGSLVAVLPQCDTEGLPLHLVWMRARQLLPKLSRLLECLQQGLQDAA
ncbi:LysR family transcriptional regulator [Xanthomonas arboricola]|uniref:LysR family transcriptional regulator n=1 Tax=Xanthomonas arboricola TaxID=56448 RepID=UPI001612C97A|nr:LysR family transcriptional regulator [Xanthomonas arboricola]MBB4728322.1 DNA-binding transcriptional LysR family regulator [Xanthomonas arboricola]